MHPAIVSCLKRFGRAALAIVIAGLICYTTKEPKMLIFAPLIQAVAKYLRDRFKLKNIPV